MWLCVSFVLLLSSKAVFSNEEVTQNAAVKGENPPEKKFKSGDSERLSRGFKQVKLRTAEWEQPEEEYEGWSTGINDNVWAEEPEALEDFDQVYYPGQQRPSSEGGEHWEDTDDEEEELSYPPQYPAYPQSPADEEVSVLDFSDDKIVDPYETDDQWTADEEEVPKKTFPDPCRLKPCRNNGICSGYGKGRYRCLCPPGYFGKNCEQRVDPCQSNPCQNGGFCSAVGQKFRCSCPDGFSGRTCEYRVTPCSRNPCLNDGICATDGHVQKCICVGGWTGRRCELPPLSCRRNPCHHGGQCHSRGKTYSCNCRSGYAGRNCEIPPPICRINPCFNGGLCHAAGKGYTCQCPAGFTGGNCEVAVRVCQNNPCFNGGICRAISKRKYVCECSGGYQGKHCELSPPACLKSPCLNGGFCSSLGRNKVACDCPSGYTGKYCEIPPHCCRDNPCRNGGRCSARGTQAVCSCYGGWTGEFCEIPPNCCITSPCQNGGTCYNVGGLATCRCPVGYSGANCEIVENNCFDGYCLNGGACAMVDGVATCSCTAAYTGKRCENKLILCDSNGCVCSENPCTNGGHCVVDGNQTKCICPASFSGEYCEVPKFECTTTYCQCGTTTCYNGGVCHVDEHHQVGCKCPWGFSGASCEYVNNICDDPLQNPCKNGGICKINWYLIFGLNGASVFTPNNKLIKDNLNSFICECPAGFYGPTCSETKQVSNCPDGVCGCPPGFRLATGGICVDDDECFLSLITSLYNGFTESICGQWYAASCKNTVGSYKCSCSPGYTIGATGKCQRIVKWSTVSSRCGSFFPLPDGRPSECDPLGATPCCSANGFCGTGDEFCTCEGCVDYSQTPTHCNESYCLNDGICTTTEGIVSCWCQPGFVGERCEIPAPHVQIRQPPADAIVIPADDTTVAVVAHQKSSEFAVGCCLSNPCQNGGTCYDLPESTACHCPVNYTGVHCETPLKCYQGYCYNGGTCDVVGEAAVCSCLPGFKGMLCEIPPKCCSDVSCKNGGTCRYMDGMAICVCPGNFTGINCEIPKDPCQDVQCPTGQVCQQGSCNCPPGTILNSAKNTCEEPCPSGLCGNKEVCVGSQCECEEGLVRNPDTGKCEVPGSCFLARCPQNETCSGLGRCECLTGLLRHARTGFCVDPCELASCGPHEVCNSGDCECEPGYSRNAQTGLCEDKPTVICKNETCSCGGAPCINGGRCIGGICVCPSSYYGRYCEIPKFECTTTYCQCGTTTCYNGGVCALDEHQEIKCKCPYGFTGPSCETLTNVCKNPFGNPCQNGGKCKINWYIIFGMNGASVLTADDKIVKENLNSYVCECPAGFYGPTCTETKPQLQCKGVACGCQPGFRLGTGGICLDNDECLLTAVDSLYQNYDDDEFQNVGTICGTLASGKCINTLGSYRCECNPGYIIGASGKCQRLDGKPAECDPLSDTPCCSPKGFCGAGEDFCTCHGCINYAVIQKNEEEQFKIWSLQALHNWNLTMKVVTTLQETGKIGMKPTARNGIGRSLQESDSTIAYDFSL